MSYYDLHIHSALSPCADNDMTLNNIVNMACIKQLEVISICDHNSLLNAMKLQEVCQGKINFIYGVEVETEEEIHVLCYFKKLIHCLKFQYFLDLHRKKIINKPNYFGNQFILDKYDQIIAEEENLLITSMNFSLSELIDQVHQLEGCAICAHVFKKANSIISQLGFIPDNLKIDGFELKDIEEKNKFIKIYPKYANYPFYFNSDAHSLIQIKEKEQNLKLDILKNYIQR